MLGSSKQGSGPTGSAKGLCFNLNTGVIIPELSSVWAVVVGSNSYVSPSITKSQVKGLYKMEAIQICKVLADWVLRVQNVLATIMYLEFKVKLNKRMANCPSRDLNISAPHTIISWNIIGSNNV